MPRRRRGRAFDGRSRLRTIRSAHHDVERRPRWTHAQSTEESASCSLPIRELVARIPAPRGDHGKNKGSALAQQVLISVGIALAHIFGDMGEVELDRSTATRLEIDEQQPGLRAEHIAWVRLAVSTRYCASSTRSVKCGVLRSSLRMPACNRSIAFA